jgi:hypothetical protein
MDVTVNFHTQDIWTWWLALYLYFGGMGAATLVVAFLTDMYMKRHKDLVLWNDLGWLIGFIGFGLLVPFALELKCVLKGWSTCIPIPATPLLHVRRRLRISLVAGVDTMPARGAHSAGKGFPSASVRFICKRHHDGQSV